MLTIKNLKKLIKDLPDDACVMAYEGEDCGLTVYWNNESDEKSGWIETGFLSEEECNPKKHDLDEFDIKPIGE